MAGIKAFLTARRLAVGIMLFLAALMFLATVVPQAPDYAPSQIAEWRRGHQGLLWLVDAAGLHKIFSQPWFVAATLFAAVTLAISTCDQFKTARKRLSATGVGGADELHPAAEKDRLRTVAGRHRYGETQEGARGELKFVRNKIGFFGNTLLHTGMVLALCGSLYVALTGRQGALILVAGDQPHRGGWHGSQHGLLTTPLPLPGEVRLDRVSLDFDAKNQVNRVSSELTISRAPGERESVSARINEISSYHDLRLYHSAQYGDAFTLEFVDQKGGGHYEKIPIQHPKELERAGYGDFDLKWTPYLLSAKYFADADRKSMTSANPLLVLRLLDRNRELARVQLTPGASATLGEYRVRLLAVQKWSNLIFVDVSGMPIVFAGFALLILGGLVHYLAPPRELIAIPREDGLYRVYWKGIFFRDFFIEERDELAVALAKGVEDEIVLGTVPVS